MASPLVRHHPLKITLYSKPNCVQCTATKRALDKAGLSYETIDVSVDDAALERIKAMGFQQAPVVELDETVIDSQERGDGVAHVSSWSGFRPDLLAQIIQ